jgi:putative phosphonate catabolism associated alcohol dehydrogenase
MTELARAVIFDGPGRSLRFEDVPLPALRPGEVLVRVRACTLCGSDLHTHAGRRSTPCPTILGHEIVGEVAGFAGDAPRGHDGEPLKAGERVVWPVAVGCGHCFFCQRDLPQKCLHLFKYGHERVREGHTLSGGLATHCHLLAGTPLFRVPDQLPDVVACPAGCATATVSSALRHSGEVRGAVVLITGAGMLGLTACAMARSLGARAVIACDVDPQRLALAWHFGATACVQVGGGSEDRLREAVAGQTDGHGADVVLEMSGSPEAVEAGLRCVRIGGTCVWVGAVFPGRAVAVVPEDVVRRHLTIRGVHNYHPRDLGEALAFLGEHHARYPFAELVGRQFPLAEAEEAFHFAKSGEAVRVAVLG